MYQSHQVVAIPADSALSAEVTFDADFGHVHVPEGSSITSLAFHVSFDAEGAFLPLYDGANAVTLSVAAGRCYAIPAAVCGCFAFKMIGDAEGSVTVSMRG